MEVSWFFVVKLKKTTRQNYNVKKRKRLAGVKAYKKRKNKEKNSTLKFLSVFSPQKKQEARRKENCFLFCFVFFFQSEN